MLVFGTSQITSLPPAIIRLVHWR